MYIYIYIYIYILNRIFERKCTEESKCIGCILRRYCILRNGIERKAEGGRKVKGRRGERRKFLVDDLKEKRAYWKLKG